MDVRRAGHFATSNMHLSGIPHVFRHQISSAICSFIPPLHAQIAYPSDVPANRASRNTTRPRGLHKRRQESSGRIGLELEEGWDYSAGRANVFSISCFPGSIVLSKPTNTHTSASTSPVPTVSAPSETVKRAAGVHGVRLVSSGAMGIVIRSEPSRES
ncbi:hypothetical protein CPC08DRAFT_374711 [Agrocybe pediades]|nr:hypothetical protein CPC08DRAFT_374711 [Agrocybe pediades]